MRYALMMLLLAVIAGCSTTKVYHRPLADVARAIDTMQPQMIADVTPECQKFNTTLGVFTNQVPGRSYGIVVGQVWNSSYGGPRFSIQATNIGINMTEVDVVRMPTRFSRSRHLERLAEDALTKRLEILP
jgi:hypothetical protein